MDKLNEMYVRMKMALAEMEEGQGLTEYALIMVLIAIAAIVTMTTLGGKISSTFTTISGKL